MKIRYMRYSAILQRNSQPCMRSAKVLTVLACALGATTARADTASAPAYVPAQNISCSYALSPDDQASAEAAVKHATRPDAAVRIWLDERGGVSDAVVEQSSGSPAFDELAVQAARRAQCRAFSGADGKPVAIQTNFVFNLPLRNADAARAGQGAVAPAGNLAGSITNPSRVSSPAGMTSPPLLATALPFEFGKPPDAAALASKLGIAPGSSKAELLADWARKLMADADIRKYFLSASDPATAGPVALTHALGVMDALARISPEDREQLMGMQTRALDNAPSDCGGSKDLRIISARYLSLETESDDALRAQLQAMFDVLKQSTQTTAPATVTAGQQLQGQLAFSASVAHALKGDPSEAEDLGLLMNGGATDLDPAAWCGAMRFYLHAFEATPQPSRDWMVLGGLEKQSRVAAAFMTALRRFAPPAPATQQQGGPAPEVFDYAERVRRRVRPNIIWSGTVGHLETVLAVHCASSGNLESVAVVRSSGNRTWDGAALEAVRRSDPMPLDENGRAPASFTITLRPGL
ncbi:TonB family protein [Paraburkholderia sp. J76]|uniref:TonB family protein n=1 Tax=Paraburkholderia sp. J76 TaxID=2805439 RepID=UPI002ABE8698|nr:TonB family protein [Paraburkholderia sp. J76]